MQNIKALGLVVLDKKIFSRCPYISHCKIVDPRGGYNLEKLGRGPLGDATYQISRLWAFCFQTRRFLKFSSRKSIFGLCNLDMPQPRTI